MRYKILDQNGLNFLTFTVVEWIDLFSRRVYKDIIIDSLRHCQQEKGLIVCGYVIMSNHLHAILHTEEQAGLSWIIQRFKSYTASQILKYIKNKRNPESRRDWLLNHFAFNARKNRANSQHQIWQRDNRPILLYTPKVIRRKLVYIHDTTPPPQPPYPHSSDHQRPGLPESAVPHPGIYPSPLLAHEGIAR